MKTCFYLIFFSLVCTISWSQEIDLKDFENLKFRNLGPAGMSGRVTAIDVDLSDTDRIFVGTASGGVWKSENGGNSWEPIFDDQLRLAIGALKINQKNPAEIWVGTGEGNPRNSMNCGGGVYKTIDGGKTWTLLGLEDTRVIHRIVIHRDNPDIVVIGASGSPWGDSPDRGVFKTTDGGKSWKKMLYVNQKTGIADLVGDPDNPNKLIAAMWEHRRQPWDFVSGGEGSGLYLSYDFGETWKEITSKEGLPKGDLGRIGLAVAPSQPDRVYALVEAKVNGLYRSDDGGENWKLVSEKNIGNRPFYYAEIYVDPHNENRIYNLWSYVSRSDDGGKSFKTIMDYGNDIHPDHHAFWIHPEDPSYLIDGNDGGLAISRDRGENWQFISNLPVGQFYHINVDDDFPYNVYGGMQDNGSWVGPGFTLKRGGIRNYDWQELYFGDGFDVSAHPEDSRYGYAMSQGGNLGFYDRKTGYTKYIKPEQPDSTKLRYNWNAALAQDPFNPDGIFYCSQFVHYSPNRGDSWKIISPDLTTNDTTKHHQDISGGLTIDATNAENYTTLLAVSPSLKEEGTIWASSDDGLLHLTRDRGKNWTELSGRLPGFVKGSWIPQVILSSINPGEAFIPVNDYRRNNWSAYAFHTSNYGKTWRRIANDEQVKGFVTSIIQDHKEENLLFLGTDVGLYVSFDKGKNWIHWTEGGFPNVQIRDMKIQQRFDDLVIGTFGRAIWVLDDLEPLRAIAKENKTWQQYDFKVFACEDAFLTHQRSYDGIRFIAQGEFVGNNKNTLAKINYWLKKKKTVADSKPKEEVKEVAEGEEKPKGNKNKIFVTVLNEQGDTIRNFSRKVKKDFSGFGSLYWGLNKNGVRYPSRKEAKKESDPPRGRKVTPGKYMIVVMYENDKDSTWVNVKPDPRREINMESAKENRKYADMLEEKISSAATAFDRITKAKKKIKLVESLLASQPDSIQKEIKEMHGNLSKTFDKIESEFMMPEGLKGIQRNPNTINALLGRASFYLGSWDQKPEQNTQRAIEIASHRVDEVIEKVNAIFAEDWQKYADRVNGLVFDPLE